MGIRSWLGFGDVVETTPAAGQTGILSPLITTNHLAQALFADLYGADTIRPVSRADALAIPPLAKARHVLTGQAGRVRFVAMTGDRRSSDGRWQRLLDQPEPWRARALTISWTVDAMLWFGRAWYLVTSRYSDGFPRTFQWTPEEAITADPAGQPLVYGRPVAPSDLLRSDGPHEGLLRTAQPQLAAAIALYRAAARAMANPVPSIDLHQTTPGEMSETDIDQLIAGWLAARTGANGGVAYSNPAIDVRVLGQHPEQLLISARKAVAVEAAQLTGLPAWALDAEVGGSSITYANVASQMRSLSDISLTPYLDAISGRLSLDDVMPAGTWCRPDLGSITSPDFVERMAGYKAAQEANVYSAAECRALERGTPLEESEGIEQ